MSANKITMFDDFAFLGTLIEDSAYVLAALSRALPAAIIVGAAATTMYCQAKSGATVLPADPGVPPYY